MALQTKTGGKKSSGSKKSSSKVQKSVVREYGFDKSTPGTHRFSEDHEEALAPTIYLKKDQVEKLLGKKQQKRIKVTYEVLS